MDSRQEILDAIEILIDKAMEKSTQIQNGTIVSVLTDNKCDVMVNGRIMNSVQYYGGAPTINKQYRVFIPNGNSSRAFIITGAGSGGGGGGTGGAVNSVNGKVGDVVLSANDVGATTQAWVNSQKFAKAAEVIDADEYADDTEAINNALALKADKTEIPDVSSKLDVSTFNSAMQEAQAALGNISERVQNNATQIANNTAQIEHAAPADHKHEISDVNNLQTELDKKADVVTNAKKIYQNQIATGSATTNAVKYYATVKPDDWYVPWRVKFHIKAHINADYIKSSNANQFYYDGTFEYVGIKQTYARYECVNSQYNTSYRPIYYHDVYRLNQTGFNNGKEDLFAVDFRNCSSSTSKSYLRDIEVELLEYENCTVTMLDDMVFQSGISGFVTSNYDGLSTFNAADNGRKMTGDANSVDRFSYNSLQVTADGTMYGGQIILSTDGVKYFSIQTKARAVSTGNVCTGKSFNPDYMMYYASDTTVSNGAKTATYNLYKSIPFDLRYSSNKTTFTTGLPVYLKCRYSFVTGLYTLVSGDWLVQNLPTTDDGCIYILIGHMYSTTTISFNANYLPKYYFKNGKIRNFCPGIDRTIKTVGVDEVLSEGSDGFTGVADEVYSDIVEYILNGNIVVFSCDVGYASGTFGLSYFTNDMIVFSGPIYSTDTTYSTIHGIAYIKITSNDELDCEIIRK